MIIVMLDGKKMINKISTHKYIRRILKTPEYYGENLDALWDVLGTCDRKIEINLINTEDLIENLGDYGESLINVFQDAENENENIILKLYERNKYRY